MKKLLLTVSALAALSLLAPSTGFAVDNNIIGFYNDTDLTASQIDGHDGLATNVYVFIHNPYDHEAGRAVENLGGFEFHVVMPAGSFVLGFNVPVNYLNVGSGNDDFIVGFGDPISIISGVPTQILSLNVFVSADPDQNMYLSTTASPAGLLGLIQILDFDTNAEIPIFPATDGDRALPIFAFNPTTPVVDNEDITFGAVKALYR